MPNGKPGDHPLTDLLTHGLPAFNPRVDELLREVARLREQQVWTELYRLIDKYDHRREEDLDALELDLIALRAKLKGQPE